jgi:hypothetical protein
MTLTNSLLMLRPRPLPPYSWATLQDINHSNSTTSLPSDALSVDLRETLEQLLLIQITHAQAIIGDRTMENDLALVVRRVGV